MINVVFHSIHFIHGLHVHPVTGSFSPSLCKNIGGGLWSTMHTLSMKTEVSSNLNNSMHGMRKVRHSEVKHRRTKTNDHVFLVLRGPQTLQIHLTI